MFGKCKCGSYLQLMKQLWFFFWGCATITWIFFKKLRFTEKCCFCTTSTAQSEASLSNGIQSIAHIKDQGASSRFTGVLFSGGMTCWNLLLSQPIWESWQDMTACGFLFVPSVQIAIWLTTATTRRALGCS